MEGEQDGTGRTWKALSDSKMAALLKRLYNNPKLPSSFGSIRSLYTEAKKRNKRITLKFVREWLKGESTYTLHAPVRKNFPRSRTWAGGFHVDMQADLADMQNLRKYNPYSYFLIVIDVFSKMTYTRPLKTKRGEEVRDAFKSIFEESYTPHRLCTDKG